MTITDAMLFEQIWSELDGPTPPPTLAFSGEPAPLPSAYAVGEFATATIAAATAAVAAVQSARAGKPARTVHVDREHAAVAFRCERYLSPVGWALPPIWDPIAGDYRTRNGWIRLHTNYRHHRDAVLSVLGTPATREAVTRAVQSWDAEALESAVVDANGCAARMRTAAQWAAHPQGEAVAREPLFAQSTWPAAPAFPDGPGAPLSGIRVLDLTRVIAGPVCTRFLAAYGADVLRIDPPGFEEVGALLPESTAGKRRATLDLRERGGRDTLERLIAGAHVMVHGYRADALDRLGLDAGRLRAINPSLIDVSHDAYGWTGPWARRRGFDSLVQMSCGIADRGREVTGSDAPFPLPAQALDHGCGYLLAAATCRALVRLWTERRATEVHLSLARTAKLLVDLGDSGDLARPDLEASAIDRWREMATTAWGSVERVRCPGHLDGLRPEWVIPAGPLGIDRPAWT